MAKPDIAEHVGRSLDSHLIVEFAPEYVFRAGKRHNPPNPRGISGGAVFRVVDDTLKLAGIMTEHRKASRAMVSVRMSEVLAIAHHIISLE